MNTYQTLCTQFYDIDKPDAPADALKFYMDYADKADGRIFEPMCGTGRFLIPMLQKGFDIVGSDGSPHMFVKRSAVETT
jgi:SAM-dependent methyltransferase